MSHVDGSAVAISTFESLLYPVLDSAYRAALNLTRERADAEDLVQDATLNALRGFGGFIPGSHFKPWFFRILHNRFLAGLRASTFRRDSVDVDDAPELALLHGSEAAGRRPFGEDPSLLAQLESDEVTTALQALPGALRAVAVLYFVDDFTYQEMAEVLDIPIGTVRSRLHRARRMLRSRLRRLAEDHGVIAA